MRRILVCSDLSERSHHAIVRATRLAREFSCSLAACSVVDDDLPPKVVEAMTQEASDDLKRKCASLNVADVEVVVETGEPVKTMLAVAARVEADLIVLGTHRHRPFWDMISGTTMERLVHASRLPVLLVPGAVKSDYSSVLAGVDFSPSCEAAMKLARTLAPRAKFTTFHAVSMPPRGWFERAEDPEQVESLAREARERLEAWWKDRDMPEGIDRPQVVTTSVPDAFRKLRHDVKPDLVAIGAHGRPGFTPGLLGGFTETIIRWQFCDVLVART